MTDKSYNNWTTMSDDAIAKQIGAYIKYCRLEQNKTQGFVAESAGISRSTLSLLERGESVTLASFIQVMRVLKQLQIMDAFVVKQQISPLALAKAQKEQRKRARNTKLNKTETPDW